jgi:hypothetical protein
MNCLDGGLILMDWLLKLVVIWISIDIVTIATGWYAINVIKPRFPNWWRQVIIADADPEIWSDLEPVVSPVPVSSQYHR